MRAIPPHAASACLWAPLLVAAASVGALVAVGWNGWPGEVGASATSVCEAIQPGPIKQPINTWSNLGFLVAGLAVGWQARRDLVARKQRDWVNPLVTTVAYPATYAVAAVLIGVGSAALHASTTPWGLELDHFGMHLWGVWCVAYTLKRLFAVGNAPFAALFAAGVVALGLRIVFDQPHTLDGGALFGLLVATAVAIELAGCWVHRAARRTDLTHLASSVGVFLVAYTLWLLSRAGGPLCWPESVWQGHAAWHLLCATSVGLVYLYGRSERAVLAPIEELSFAPQPAWASSSSQRRYATASFSCSAEASEETELISVGADW